MINYALAMLLSCGQVTVTEQAPARSVHTEAHVRVHTQSPEGVYAIYYEPKTYYHYKLGLMREKSRSYETVNYPTGPRKVPIINGYVPDISEVTNAKGEKHVTYDYRKRVRYSATKANQGRMP